LAEENRIKETILKKTNLLEIIDGELNKKVVQEHDARKTVFMVANMRNVENLGKATDNIIVNAPSGAGKEVVTEAVFDLLPEQEKEELIRTTPKVLAYTRNRKIDKDSTWKKTALRLEDIDNTVLNDNAFKVMISANPNKLNKAKTINKSIVIEVEIDGKPSIIGTAADATMREEQLRRLPICSLDEGIDQTKEILKRQASYAKTGKSIDFDDDVVQAMKMLRRIKVRIPFADRLVSIFCPENVIVRTHFPRFLDYIKSSCALYQYQRQQDCDGYFIAERQDFDIAAMMLAKTTSNILMIPLDRTKKTILQALSIHNIERQSTDDLEDLPEIQQLNITTEWFRRQLDWLVSKHFLLKDKEKRTDEAGKTIPKPVFIYTYNKLQKLEIPTWEQLSETTTITANSEITMNSTNTTNTTNNVSTKENSTSIARVIVVNSQFVVKKHCVENEQSSPEIISNNGTSTTSELIERTKQQIGTTEVHTDFLVAQGLDIQYLADKGIINHTKPDHWRFV
jgi:hypothetical protein